jgi:uncharacterized OB-fold protein
MPEYEYRGLNLTLNEWDTDHIGYFEAAARHELVMKKCADCGLLRWEPGPGCPWCTSQEWEWAPVSGKGTIYSYEIVTQAIMPAFKDWVPYPVVLVELDEQRGVPTEHEALRMFANLVDNELGPEQEENVAIGKRVEVVFMEIGDGFALPQFRLTSEPPPGETWQFTAE